MSIGEFIGGAFDKITSLFGQNADRQLQERAMTRMVRDRVTDAKKAGVHPLAALGMSPVSVSPVSVGDSGFTNMGASLDRAVAAGSTRGQRVSNLEATLLETNVEGARLDNDIKRAELASRVARLGNGQTGPGMQSVVPPVEGNTARGGDVGGQTLPLPFGPWWNTGRTATAEEVERQYGDVVQEAYGMIRLGNDALTNVERHLKSAPGAGWLSRMLEGR